MTNGMQTIARSLADAAQAMGADAMSALAAELAARQAAPKAAPEGDFSGASFAASRKAGPTVTATVAAAADDFNITAARVAIAFEASRAAFDNFNQDLLRDAVKAVGANKAHQFNEVEAEADTVTHLKWNDRLTFAASRAANKSDRIDPEGFTISHPLFTVTIKPRG